MVSGSIDRTAKIWDIGEGRVVQTLRGHNDEILDVVFSPAGNKLATASADGTARVYGTATGTCQAICIGHDGEISKVRTIIYRMVLLSFFFHFFFLHIAQFRPYLQVSFSPSGSRLLTASSDHTAVIWDSDSGDIIQRLEGHTDEIFSAGYNYEGDTIITGSKDNTCRIWRTVKEGADGMAMMPGYD